jgi:hypothetical protein
LQMSSAKSAKKRLTPNCISNWWVGSNLRTFLTSKSWSKRKSIALESTVENHTLPLCPVNQSFCESRFGSVSTSESRFGLLCVGILIIVLCHCSSDTVECSADKLMRSATASQAQRDTNWCITECIFTCFILKIIWDSVLST